MKPCRACKRPIVNRSAGACYCLDCVDEGRGGRRRVVKPRICRHCDGEITGRSKCAKYCLDCAASGHGLVRRRKPYTPTKRVGPKRCSACSRPIVNRARQARICLQCFRKKAIAEPKPCKHCGEPVLGLSRHAKVCQDCASVGRIDRIVRKESTLTEDDCAEILAKMPPIESLDRCPTRSEIADFLRARDSESGYDIGMPIA